MNCRTVLSSGLSFGVEKGDMTCRYMLSAYQDWGRERI
jgi:hypothetical protein